MIAFPSPVPGEPVRVSATLYRAYRQCPTSAKGRLEGHYPPETPRSFAGALTHRLIRRHLDGGPIAEADLAQVCREEIGSGLNHQMAAIGVRSPSQLLPFIEEATRLYRRFATLAVDGFREAERSLCAQPSPGVELIGKVDAVFEHERGFKLVDWKTGGLGEPFDQLAFYALVWALETGEAPALVEAVSIETGERHEAVLSASDLAQVARNVSELVSAVRRAWADGSSLALVGGPWCRYCALLEGCPEGESTMRVLGD